MQFYVNFVSKAFFRMTLATSITALAFFASVAHASPFTGSYQGEGGLRLDIDAAGYVTSNLVFRSPIGELEPTFPQQLRPDGRLGCAIFDPPLHGGSKILAGHAVA